MSTIPGERALEHRRNFHGTKGEHLFPHPKTYARRSEWTGWDQAYAAHLDRHAELAENPEPQDDDPQVVLDLFAHIESLRRIIKKEQQLIIAIRQKAAQAPETDDLSNDDIRRILRGGEGS